MYPANDINPIETGNGLKLNITENDNALDLKLAFEVCNILDCSKKELKK